MNLSQAYGLPSRIAGAVHALLERDGDAKHERKLFVLANILRDFYRIPLTAGEGAIYSTAERAAGECFRILAMHDNLDMREQAKIREAIRAVCDRLGVTYPRGADDQSAWARACDKQWWVRALRKEFARRFENTCIQLGQVGKGIDPYITRESALRQAARNEENAKALQDAEIVCNDGPQAGQIITLAQAAAAGMANKKNRRGELMTRIKGFEEIATELKHAALFITQTAPSKYHAVGGRNAKYQDFTPREAQAYLSKVWSRQRAALQRAGITVYGFRVAEPHEDGCPHWHLLLFCKRAHLPGLRRIIKEYALQEDGNEAGAKKQRVKLVRMESGKGTAAGYIAKYISKNIDGLTEGGASMGEHLAYAETDGGGVDLRKLEAVKTGRFQGRDLTPSERVTFWSQVHGIRQFQQIGGAPVGVWRELRRIDESALECAPHVVRQAWEAVQKRTDGETVKQADWKQYVMLQGGPGCGRDAAIQLWKKEVEVHGRYGIVPTDKPCGVWAVTADELYRVPSVRYSWKPVQAAAAPVFPWTCVNNCTGIGPQYVLSMPDFDPEKFSNLALWAGREMKKHDPAIRWDEIQAAGDEKEAESKALAAQVRPAAVWYADGGGGLAESFAGPLSVTDILARWARLEALKAEGSGNV